MIVVGKDRVREVQSATAESACFRYMQLPVAPAFSLHIPSANHIRHRTPTNHREMERTIAQRFIGSVHSVETRILRFRIEQLRGSRMEEAGSSLGGYLATSVDQLMMLTKHAREVAKALPSDKAHPARPGKRKACTSNGLALGRSWVLAHRDELGRQG
jgi:hypothetical protein